MGLVGGQRFVEVEEHEGAEDLQRDVVHARRTVIFAVVYAVDYVVAFRRARVVLA